MAILNRWRTPLAATMDDHNPHIVYRRLLGSLLYETPFGHPWSWWGTIYGAAAGNIAIVDDCKIYDGPLPADATWVSLDDWSWKAEAGQQIRAMFRNDSVLAVRIRTCFDAGMGLFSRKSEPEPTVVAVYQGSDRLEQFHPNSLQGMKVASALQASSYRSDQFQASAVYRGAMLLADLVAQLPWYAYAGGDPTLTGQARLEKPVKLPEQPQLLINPSTDTDRDQLLRQLVLSAVFHGDMFAFGNLHDRDGRPTNVRVLPPTEVTEHANAANTAASYQWNGATLRPGYDLFMDFLNRRPGTWRGVGPLEAGASIVDGIRNADGYARKLFRAGVPSGVLKVPGKMTKDEADKLKAQWDEQHAGGRGTAVLAGGIEFEGISLTPEQAQFLSTRAYGSQEVSRLLGIPQWFLNAGSPPGTASALTYQNLNQVFVELTRTTLKPTYLRRIERMFSAMLPRGQAVMFDLSEFLQSDLQDRASAAKQLVDARYDPTDVAEMLGLPLGHLGPAPQPVMERENVTSE